MRNFLGLPVLSCALLCLSVAALAQPNSVPPAADSLPFAVRQAPSSAADSVRPEVEELDLPIYLKDKDGKLQVVPGFTLEEFDELWNLRNQMPAQAPRPAASLAAVVVSGSVVESRADLEIELTIDGARDRSLGTRTAAGPAAPPGWIDIPLALPEARLTAPPKHEGSGQHRLLYDQDKGRYVSWLSATDDSEQRVILHAQAPIETQGHVSRLKLTLPAATQSRLSIQVPRNGIIGELAGGSGGQLAQEVVGGGTVFTVIGARGECQLVWRETAVASQTVPAALEAAGILVVKIDGRSAQINARLTVSSLNQGAFDRFQVALPAGAVYLTGQAADYSVGAIEREREGRPVLEFTRPLNTADPFTVYLTTELARDNPLADNALELGGFDVTGALQQYGHLVLEADENWRLLWEHGPNVRQISNEQFLEDQSIGLAEPLPIGRPLAAFEYFSQPFSFPVRVAPRTTRVEVDPKYAFTIGPKRIGLDARLKYTVRGTGVFSLEIDLPGWEIDPEGFQPSTLINLDDLVETEVAPLRIPLFSPTSGELEIAFRATRSITAGADSITIEMPRPRADFLRRAEVAIIPEDNVELSPLPDAMVGLSRHLNASMRLPTRQQPSLAYRAEQPDARFVAGYQVHAGRVTANLRSAVRLEQTQAEVRQQLEYFIAYEPLDQMVLEMPRPLADSGQVEFTLDGQLLTQSRAPDTQVSADRPARVRVSLPAERRIGAGVMAINYPLTLSTIAPASSKVQAIPLVTPVGVELLSNELNVAAPADWQIQSGSAGWTESTTPLAQTGDSDDLHLTASLPQTAIDLRVTREDESSLSATMIERAWIQTWLTPTERVERVLFRVMTGKNSLAFTLPGGADRARVEVSVDGQARTVERQRGSPELAIRLNDPAVIANSGTGERHEYLVEIRYPFSSRARGLPGSEPLAPLRFTSDVRIGRTYWQLVLPRDWHLVSGPEGYVCEYEWTWNGWCFVRRSLMDQAELDGWIGAERSPPLPLGTNRYLFSSMQGLPPQQFQVAGRWQIVLAASATALVAGLLLLYVPACRRPPALFIAGVAGLALAALYPDPAALFLQAASLGLALTLVAVTLRRTLATPERRPSAARRSPSSIVRRVSPSSKQRPPLVGSAASTETRAPSPLEIGSQEPPS